MTEVPQQSGAHLSRRGVERLDLLLLTVEALDLNGGEAMLWTSHQMGLQPSFPIELSYGSGGATTRFAAQRAGSNSIPWMPNP